MVRRWEESGSDEQQLDQETLMNHINLIATVVASKRGKWNIDMAEQWGKCGKNETALKFATGNILL